MFDLLSLALGLTSWILPLTVLKRYMKNKKSEKLLVFTASFASCVGALIFQLLELRRRIIISDWAGLNDTIGVTVWAAVILVAAAVLLNALALRAANDKDH